jgi:hypothetical protein
MRVRNRIDSNGVNICEFEGIKGRLLKVRGYEDVKGVFWVSFEERVVEDEDTEEVVIGG